VPSAVTLPTGYRSMPCWTGNTLAAVDIETTGLRAGFHEIIQIAVVPVDFDLQPSEDTKPFYCFMRPEHPDRINLSALRKNGISVEELESGHSRDQAADAFQEWFRKLNLPLNRRLLPLASNWAFEFSFLTAWLGHEGRDMIFDSRARDTMVMAACIDDRRTMQGLEPMFDRYNLAELCRVLEVTNQRPHNALSDCLAEIECYRRMLRLEWE
jgi:DNA polymerase III epsilon subunit-like protein